MKRVLPLALLIFMAVVGAVLVLMPTESSPDLDVVTTVDGVVIDVPAGWTPSTADPFRYEPPGADLSNVDSWTVAWACGPDGCAVRSLDEWMSLAPRIETFRRARADEGTLLFDIVETANDDSLVMTATAAGGQTIVAVAVFHDGADHYLECDLSILGDPGGLDEAIVDSCKSAQVPS